MRVRKVKVAGKSCMRKSESLKWNEEVGNLKVE